MPIGPLQKATAQAIVNIFETGRALGDYGNVTVAPGDPGHLSYGRSQTTLASGNLHLLLKAYCEAPGAEFASEIAPFLPRLAERDLSLDRDSTLKPLLREAGDDPVMQDVQDAFFDRVYWTPATRHADNLQLQSPLGTAVVYDSFVHGSWIKMRDRTVDQHGGVSGDEKKWIGHYIAVRRNWLETHSNLLLRRTVYRMDALEDMRQKDNWDLKLPCLIRDVQVTESLLLGTRPRRISAEDEPARTLRLATPLMTGQDVAEVQLALKKSGFAIDPDGIYGPLTEAMVRRFQELKGLRVDGIVGPGTKAELGI